MGKGLSNGGCFLGGQASGNRLSLESVGAGYSGHRLPGHEAAPFSLSSRSIFTPSLKRRPYP